MFLDEKKASFVEKAGGNYKQGISKAAKAWGELSPAEKKPYNEEAARLKVQYNKELKAFLDAGGQKKRQRQPKKPVGGASLLPRKAKKECKKPAPKKPVGGAYGCFLNKNRAAYQQQCKGLPVTAVSRMACEAWKTMSTAEKQPFENEYAVKKKAYEEAMRTYRASGGGAAEEEEDDGERTSSKRRKTDGKDAQAPKRPAGGAFGCHLNENRAAFQQQCTGGCGAGGEEDDGNTQ